VPVSLARKIAAAKKEAAKKRGRGGNSFSPYPFFFSPRQSGKVFCSAARSAAIKLQSPDFRQNKFEFCPKNIAIYNLYKIKPNRKLKIYRNLKDREKN